MGYRADCRHSAALYAALIKLDLTHDFYRSLDMDGERDIPLPTCFRLRIWHTLAVTNACSNVRRDKDGRVDLSTDNSETAAHLYRSLVRDLESKPLRRDMEPIDEIDEKYGDLKWLKR